MLTGDIRYRVTRWRQRLVIQVAEWAPAFTGGYPVGYRKFWRDATPADVWDFAAGNIHPERPIYGRNPDPPPGPRPPPPPRPPRAP